MAEWWWARALVTPAADGKRRLSNRGNVIRVQVVALMRPWCNSTRSQHAPPGSLQSVSSALSPRVLDPPPEPAARVCLCQRGQMVWAATAAATAAHPHSNGCGARARPPSAPHPNGGRGRVHRPRPPSIGQGRPLGRWPPGPCGARGVAWRNQPMGAPNCTPPLAPRWSRTRPASGPPTHPATRAPLPDKAGVSTNIAEGWAGWELWPRGGHQQAAKQSLGENEGVRLEPPPPLDTATHHTSAERARAAQHQHSTDGAEARLPQ